MFKATTKSAIEYARQNNLEEWIHTFLCGEGDNKGLSDGLKLEKRYYQEPKLMDLDLFQRCYGPEPGLKYSIREDDEEQIKYFWKNIAAIAERYKTGEWDMPPLIIQECDGVFELNDGNHRYEALKKLGIKEYWVILWGTVFKTNYSDHAAYWDWDEYDNSDDYNFWCKMSGKYGRRVLSAMGAQGQAGAYMAGKGYNVTVLDYTHEMIAEGKKRFGGIDGLDFVQADICAFDLKEKSFDFCFISGQDIHLLPTIEAVNKALINIREHLRDGGGFCLEVCYPLGEPHSFSVPRVEPRVPRKDGVYIWKENKGNYDAETQTQNIHQTVHIEKRGTVETFEHFVSLRYYDRQILLDAFQKCGYKIIGEYCNHNFDKSDNPLDNNIFELEKLSV